MCGLVGCAGDLVNKHERAFRNLLVLDSLRGEDSTGVAFVNKWSGNVTVAKQVGDPYALFQDNRFINNMAKLSRALIGHNRFATSGGVSRANAHPFELDTLVGVHNGTLRGKHKLEDHQDFKVDSHNLFHHIEKKGVDDAVAQLGGDDNAWALVWWDKLGETLHLLRNSQRPLYLTMAENDKVLFWASEAWMLYAALARNDIKHGEVKLLDENMLVSVNINNKGEMDKPTVRRVAAPAVAPIVHRVWTSNNAQVSNVGNVPAKKPVVETPKLNVVTSYVKDALLEILCVCEDDRGGVYYSLFDPKRQFDDIRLYKHKDIDYLMDHLGEDITGDISEFVKPTGNTGRGYFKVSPSTVKLVLGITKKTQEQLTDVPPQLFLDSTGDALTAEEWSRMYKDCAWCSDALVPGAANRFTTGGECLCPSCANSPEALEYVKLI